MKGKGRERERERDRNSLSSFSFLLSFSTFPSFPPKHKNHQNHINSTNRWVKYEEKEKKIEDKGALHPLHIFMKDAPPPGKLNPMRALIAPTTRKYIEGYKWVRSYFLKGLREREREREGGGGEKRGRE